MSYYREAQELILAGEYDLANLKLSLGAVLYDQDCMIAVGHILHDKISWHDQADYLEKHFDDFDLNKTWKDFIRDEGSLFSPNFRECANALGISIEELSTCDYVKWVLEIKDNVPKEKIDSFWRKMRVYHYCDFQKKLIREFGF